MAIHCKRVSFADDAKLAIEMLPVDVLEKYEEAYDEANNKYVGCQPYERSARILQRFLKKHLLPLALFNDRESELHDRMQGIFDLQAIELESVEEDKQERLAELRQEWEDETKPQLEREELERLSQERCLRYETMDEIGALKADYDAQKAEHGQNMALLQEEQRKADQWQKVQKLQRRQWKQERLMNEAKEEVEKLRGKLNKVEQDIAVVGEQQQGALTCIQNIAELLDKQGLSWLDFVKPEQAKILLDQELLNLPMPTPAETKTEATTTSNVSDDDDDEKRKDTPSPTSVAAVNNDNKQINNKTTTITNGTTNTKKKKRPSRTKSKTQEQPRKPKEPVVIEDPIPRRRRRNTPKRSSTLLLDRMQGYFQRPSKSTTTTTSTSTTSTTTSSTSSSTAAAQQELLDRRQRFAHAKDLSEKELSQRGKRPSHIFSYGKRYVAF